MNEGTATLSERRLSRRFWAWLLVAVLTANLLVVSLGVNALLQSRAHLRERVEIHAKNLAEVLTLSIASRARLFENTLERTARELREQLVAGRRNDERINRFLQNELDQLAEVQAIHVMDEDGWIRWGRDINPAKLVNSSDRDYYQQHRATKESRLVVSPPTLGRVSGRWVMTFTRPYFYPDGRFAGVILVSSRVDGFSALLAQVDTGQHGTVVLRHGNMGLVARHPPLEGPAGVPGNAKVSDEFKALVDSGKPVAQFHTANSPDGIERTYAYRRVGELPLTIAVGMARDEYLTAWREEADRMLAMLATFTLLTLASAWIVARHWRMRRRVEAELQRSEGNLHRAQAVAHVGSWAMDIPSSRLEWTEETYRIFGLEPGSPMDLPRFMTLIHPDDAAKIGAAWTAALAGAPYDIEHRILVDGKVRWVQERANIEFSPAGQPLSGIGTVRDITEQKQHAESDAFQREGAELKARVMLALQGADADLDARIAAALAAFEGLSGLRPGASATLIFEGGDSTAKYHHGAPLWHQGTPELTGDVRCVANCALKAPEHGHYFVPLTNGSDRLGVLVLDTEVNPPAHQARLDALRIVGESFALALINERAARLLQLTMSKVEAANLSKSQFLATMSHEIRTPMNGILGMAQLLLMDEADAKQRQEYVRTILNSGQTLLTLLNDILDLSKIEAGKFDLEPRVFEPAQLIDEVAALFENNVRAKGLACAVAWRGPQRRYRADPTRLRQMLSNLISNAVKFTERGQVSIEGEVLPAAAEQGVMLRFSVADSGIGIPADKLDMLFKPFSQADSSMTRKYGGTGLGLSIVRNLAELMGGTAGVESSLGQGSRFWFTLCAEEVPDAADTRQLDRENMHAPGAAATAARLAGRVLLVEDIPTNRTVVLHLLGKQGIDVDSVEDGAEAVARVTGGEHYDLVLMDCQMPVMDGYDATAAIRAWERDTGRAHLPIIALTAAAFEEDRRHCAAVGMDDFLAKPVNLETLTEVLIKWLPRQSVAAAGAVSASVATRPVDRAAVLPLLARLEALLHEHSFGALRSCEELESRLAGSVLQDPARAIAVELRNFDYAAAERALSALAQALESVEK